MSDLIPPHGGVSEPVNRTVPSDEIGDFCGEASGWKRVPVSDADLSSLYRLGDGGLSPLTGPMDRATFERVLDEEVILHNGKTLRLDDPDFLSRGRRTSGHPESGPDGRPGQQPR